MTFCRNCGEWVHRHYGQWVHVDDNRTRCFTTIAEPAPEKEEVLA